MLRWITLKTWIQDTDSAFPERGLKTYFKGGDLPERRWTLEDRYIISMEVIEPKV